MHLIQLATNEDLTSQDKIWVQKSAPIVATLEFLNNKVRYQYSDVICSLLLKQPSPDIVAACNKLKQFYSSNKAIDEQLQTKITQITEGINSLVP